MPVPAKQHAPAGGFMRRLVQSGLVAGTLGALLALGAPAELAGGNGAQAFTQNDHDVTDSVPSANPCTGDPGTLAETYDDVFHGTINKTGSWFTGNCLLDFVP
jgi:hypothetical protein